jgi:hypothetical protein
MGLYDFLVGILFCTGFGKVVSWYVYFFGWTDLDLMEKGVGTGLVDKESIEDLNMIFQTRIGQKVLDWIDAYSNTSGSARSCWVGDKKKMVCMTWRESESSDDEM